MVTPLEFRGPKNGRCNICGEEGPLTEDHTPPKGCYRPTAMEVQHLHEALACESGARRYRANNGVRFRSLCARCNNEHLGANYDLALIEFSKRLSQAAMFSETLPSAFSIRGKPQKIARSVFGHLAAAAVDGYGKWKGYEELRDWFLSGKGALPADLSLHYWFYPFKPQVIVRGFGFTPMAGSQSIFVGWVIKFFPVAFLFVTHDDGAKLDLPEMGMDSALELDAEVELPISLRPVVQPNWPEAHAGEHGMVLSGDYAMRAVERPRR